MEISKRQKVRAARNMYTSDNGELVFHILLENGDITVELTNIGASVVAIRMPGRDNIKKNIVAGYADLNQYRINKDYLGSVVGRYANRIAGGKFMIGEQQHRVSINDHPNHLHGGISGFSHKIWDLEELFEEEHACGACFSYLSADGEEGYPGNLTVKVTYLLCRDNRLSISFEAHTDKSTPVNLTTHTYFNLTGFEEPTIRRHQLLINADYYTEKSMANTATGTILPVRNTPLDFSRAKSIGDGIDSFAADGGFDHNFVLKQNTTGAITEAAVLSEATSGRQVRVLTDNPGIQLYTANFWDGTIVGEQGYLYRKHGGVALETQFFPNSVNHAHFPNTLLHPGQEYKSKTIFEFSWA